MPLQGNDVKRTGGALSVTVVRAAAYLEEEGPLAFVHFLFFYVRLHGHGIDFLLPTT